MKKAVILFSLFCFLCAIPVVQAADTIFVRETRIPILIERQDNVLFYLRLDAKESQTLNDVVLNLGEGVNLSEIQSIKLYYGGTEHCRIVVKNVLLLLDIFPVTLRGKHLPPIRLIQSKDRR